MIISSQNINNRDIDQAIYLILIRGDRELSPEQIHNLTNTRKPDVLHALIASNRDISDDAMLNLISNCNHSHVLHALIDSDKELSPDHIRELIFRYKYPNLFGALIGSNSVLGALIDSNKDISDRDMLNLISNCNHPHMLHALIDSNRKLSPDHIKKLKIHGSRSIRDAMEKRLAREAREAPK